MQRLLAFAAGTLLLFGAADIASADPVSFYDSAQQTESYQYFEFWFNPVPAPKPGDPGYFFVYARGDYSDWNPDEYLSWDIEGIIGDPWSGPFYAGTIIDTDGYNDIYWYQTYLISPSDLNGILADGKVHIQVQLSDRVHQPLFDHRTQQWVDNQQAGVRVGIYYNTETALAEYGPNDLDWEHYVPVPEPSLLALAGLGGLLVLRRRRRKLQQS